MSTQQRRYLSVSVEHKVVPAASWVKKYVKFSCQVFLSTSSTTRSDEAKQTALDDQTKHLDAAKDARQYYKEAISSAKQAPQEICHISFDMAQQVSQVQLPILVERSSPRFTMILFPIRTRNW